MFGAKGRRGRCFGRGNTRLEWGPEGCAMYVGVGGGYYFEMFYLDFNHDVNLRCI